MNDLVLFQSFARGNKVATLRSNNCVIYTRVSTKEQMDNNMSLDTQRKSCELFAGKQGYHIMGCFGGTYESAKTDERKEFNKMLSFVKKCREKISYIIVYSVDRFSRSGGNAIYITEQLRGQGILVQSVSQPTDSTTPSGSLQQNIQFIFSEYDNQLRREKCVTGMKEALLRGEWIGKLPLGYSTIKENGKRKIIVNKEGKLLQKAFLWKANEGVTNEEVIRRLTAIGLKLPNQRVSDLFKNPFYCGVMVHQSLEGKVLEGKHEKLISKEIFLRVNDIQLINPHGYKVTVENDNISLKRFMRCEKCGEFMTGYIAQKNQKFYYKCRTKGCGVNKRADTAHEKFKVLLSDYTIVLTPGTEHFLRKHTMNVFNKLNEEKLVDSEKMQNQLTELDKKLNRLEERFIEEDITKEMFFKYQEKNKQEKLEIEKQIAKSGNRCSNLENILDAAIGFVTKFKSLWDCSDYIGRQRLQFMIFPEGVFYDKKKDAVRTGRINVVFEYFTELAKIIAKKKTGKTQSNLSFPGLVGVDGIEPPTLCL